MKRVSITERRQQNGQPPPTAEGLGVATYTSSLSKPPENVAKVKVTLRMPADVAQLLDEVYGRARTKDAAANKGDIAAEGLRPFLETRLKKLRAEDLEAMQKQLADMSA
jgi:hypothetical protein